MAQQTSVSWLIEFIQDHCIRIDEKVIEKAKQMEKEQIINADLNGSTRTALGSGFTLSERRVKELAHEYYNETYNK